MTAQHAPLTPHGAHADGAGPHVASGPQLATLHQRRQRRSAVVPLPRLQSPSIKHTDEAGLNVTSAGTAEPAPCRSDSAARFSQALGARGRGPIECWRVTDATGAATAAASAGWERAAALNGRLGPSSPALIFGCSSLPVCSRHRAQNAARAALWSRQSLQSFKLSVLACCERPAAAACVPQSGGFACSLAQPSNAGPAGPALVAPA